MDLPVTILMSKYIKELAWLLASNTNKNFFSARDASRHLFQGSRAVKDTQVTEFINNLLANELHLLTHNVYLEEFQTTFFNWVKGSTLGLSLYNSNFSNGTTQAFDSFYLRHSNKRFRCFVGEYFYHLKSWISLKKDWKFIDDITDLLPGDAVVISAPFCDTGSMHPYYETLLTHCSENSIPVLVDCCYYPISRNIILNFEYDCIDTVCFSLSKAFPVANYRIGVRYTKSNIVDGQTLLNNINYNNNFAAFVGLKIINNFSSDYIFLKYQEKQKKVCNTMPGLTISDCSIFAVGDANWDQYSRRNLLEQYQLDFDPKLFTNRICLNSIYENWNLFEHYANITEI
jgi:hypothetical protein